MYGYRTGVADHLSAPTVRITVAFHKCIGTPRGFEPGASIYFLVFAVDEFQSTFFNYDYEAVRQTRTNADENSHHPKAPMENRLRINNADLPPVPDLML